MHSDWKRPPAGDPPSPFGLWRDKGESEGEGEIESEGESEGEGESESGGEGDRSAFDFGAARWRGESAGFMGGERSQVPSQR